jgi:hypothetical protein
MFFQKFYDKNETTMNFGCQVSEKILMMLNHLKQRTKNSTIFRKKNSIILLFNEPMNLLLK